MRPKRAAPRPENLNIRVSRPEREALERAAGFLVPVSRWARHILLREADVIHRQRKPAA